MILHVSTFSEGDQEERINIILTGLQAGYCDLKDVELTDGRRVTVMFVNPEKFPDLAADGPLEILEEDMKFLKENKLVKFYAYN